jgi:hypothetical protein
MDHARAIEAAAKRAAIQVIAVVHIPVAVKLSPFFSTLRALAQRLGERASPSTNTFWARAKPPRSGAPWIWNVARDRWLGATELLDFYHASQHLWEIGRALTGSELKAQAWVLPRRHRLGQTILLPTPTECAIRPWRTKAGPLGPERSNRRVVNGSADLNDRDSSGRNQACENSVH